MKIIVNKIVGQLITGVPDLDGCNKNFSNTTDGSGHQEAVRGCIVHLYRVGANQYAAAQPASFSS